MKTSNNKTKTGKRLHLTTRQKETLDDHDRVRCCAACSAITRRLLPIHNETSFILVCHECARINTKES